MDIVFLSCGALNPKIESFFRRLKQNNPNIIRIHGLRDEYAYGIGAKAAQTDQILFINTVTHGINKDFDINELQEKYEVLNKTQIKIPNIPYHTEKLDLLYLTYEEKQAEDEFVKLLQKYPKLKRLHHVTGLYNAVNLGAQMSESPYYVMIDGDNEVLDDFNLYDVEIPQNEQMNFYMTRNAVNDLEYGYGGIKVCPTANFRRVTNDKIDPTASGNLEKVHGIRKVASVTRFNTSPFDAWKAGFREAVMLVNQDPEFKMNNDKVRQKLLIWQTRGQDRPFGKYTIQGAILGEKYGLKYKNNQQKLFRINNPLWLEKYFNKTTRQ